MTIDCREVRNKLTEYQLGGLEESERAALADHLVGCAACRAELEALARLDDLLSPMTPLTAPTELWGGIAARLQPRRAHWWQWAVQWPRPALAAAAMIMVALGLALSLRGQEQVVPSEMLTPAYQEQQIVAEWSSPLADDAALGVMFVSLSGVDAEQ